MNPIKLHRTPLPQQIAATLRDEIGASMAPGQRLDSESALAKRFGVSLVTLRSALSTLAEQGIVEIRHGSGTYIADRLSKLPVALLVGINFPYPQVTYPALRATETLGRLLTEAGLMTRSYWVIDSYDGRQSHPSYTSFLNNIIEGRLRGIVVVRGLATTEWIDVAQQAQIPRINADDTCSVGIDMLDVVRQGVRHLVNRGRRRIALMSWLLSKPSLPKRHDIFIYGEEIRRVFRETLRECGVSLRPEWIQGDLHPTILGAGYEQFYKIWMATDEKPDAILVMDDHYFPDIVIAVLQLRILVPNEFMLVTIANRGAVTCSFFPATRMEFDPDGDAQVLADMAIKRFRGEAIATPKVYSDFRWMEYPLLTGAGGTPYSAVRQPRETAETPVIQ